MDVKLRPNAEKQFNKMNEPFSSIVTRALDNLSLEPPRGDIKPLAGTQGYFRLRTSKIRILFTVENNVIFVADIVPRGQAYTKKTMEGKK